MRPIRSLLPVLLASLVLAAPALGQGTSGTFPDPISSRELTRIAQRIDLSAEQRLALDGDHVVYLEAFTALRDGAIAAYLEESSSMWRMMMSSPDTDAARRTVNDLDKIAGQIRRLDEDLFDQLQTVLSPDQVDMMPLVRNERERTRNRAGLVRFIVSGNPSMRVDFATILADAQLTPDETAQVAPLLQDYEMQLTSLTRRLQEKTHDGFVKLVEALEAGAAEQGGGGGGRWNMMRSLMNDASKEPLAIADDIAQLNKRFHEQLQASLGARTGDTVRTAFYRIAYADVFGAMTETLPSYEAALALGGLDADTRSAVEAGRDDLAARLEPLTRRMIETQDALRKRGSRWGMGEDLPEQRRMEELIEQGEAMNEDARERLAGLLGADRMATLRATMPEDSEDGAVIALASGRIASASSASSAGTNAEAPSSNRVDPYVPGPITETQVAQYARWMGLDDSDTALLGGLHLDYLDAYDIVRSEHVDPIVAANEALWALDEERGNITGPDAERVSEIFAMRAAAVDAVAGADKAFFDTVEITLGADERAAGGVIRARLVRERERFTIERNGGGGIRPANSWLSRLRNDGPSEADVDLSGLVDEIAPDSAADAEAALILLRWERDTAPIAKERYTVALELDEAMQRLNAAMVKSGGRREAGAIFGRSGYREMLETAGPRLRELAADAIEISRETIAALDPELSSTENTAIERAYREAAHPSIYDDPESPEADLLLALGLDDLRPDQRESLSETLAEYRGPYVDLCQQMVELERGEANGWAERRTRRQALERIRFERSELNQRTRRQLEFVLDEEQRQRLTGP